MAANVHTENLGCFGLIAFVALLIAVGVYVDGQREHELRVRGCVDATEGK